MIKQRVRPAILRLSGHDAAYLRRETPTQPMHFVIYLTAGPGQDGPLGLEDLRAHVRDRLDAAPALRHRLKWAPFHLGDPVWVVDRSFDVSRHVIAGHQFDEIDPLVRPIDRTRPLWQLVMSDPAADGSVRLALRFHHALADGGAVRWLLEALFGQAPALLAQAVASPSSLRLLVDAFRKALIARTRRNHPAPAVVAAQAGSVFAGPVGPRRALGVSAVSLDELRRRRRDTGATINTLYLAAISSALRAFMQRRELPLPDSGVLTLVPRDVRSENEVGVAGNRTETMVIHLPVVTEDPAERLRIVDSDIEAAKRNLESVGNVGLRFDVSASNVILGRDFSVAGRPISGAAVGGPLQGRNRLVVVGLSLDDVFSISVTTDGEWCPDADVIAADIAAALVETPVDALVGQR